MFDNDGARYMVVVGIITVSFGALLLMRRLYSKYLPNPLELEGEDYTNNHHIPCTIIIEHIQTPS